MRDADQRPGLSAAVRLTRDLHVEASRRTDHQLEGRARRRAQQVTVLFADLKGSMELLADRDPEEARRILDPVLELMMEAVHRYEGNVTQVMGDGVRRVG